MFSELKRRKVYRVGAAYLAVAYAVLEGSDMVFPALGVAPGIFNALVLLGILGFPLVLALAWTFDVTPGSVHRTSAIDADETKRFAPDPWGRIKAALVGAGFVAVVWVGVRQWQPLGRGAAVGVPTQVPLLAVLPFEDFSPDEDQAYFADGLHDELLHQLAKIPGIRLISRTSASHFRGSPTTAKAIADSLGADYVLEGGVTVVGDSVRLTVQLIDGNTDEHVWSEALGRRLTLDGLFDLQRSLAIRVGASLVGTLTEGGRERLGIAPTSSLDAYTAYLRGRHQWSRMDIDNMWNALDQFERAVSLDPGFGRAHAQLALLLAVVNNYGGGTQGTFFPRIREHAEAAMRLAPDEPQSHMAMMSVHWPIEWNWEAARREAEVALELDPDYVDALWALAEWHGVIGGNTDLGLETLRRAEALDPFSTPIRIMRIWILVNARRFGAAAAECRRILETEPTNASASLQLVSALALDGRPAEAREVLEPLVEGMPTPLPAAMAVYLARIGKGDDAREVLEAAIALKESGGSVPASAIAAGYAVLGERKLALDWLERSFATEGGIYYLRSPDWDNVADDPRFHALWDRVGLKGPRLSVDADEPSRATSTP